MTYEGVLHKMQTEIGHPIQYYLVFETGFLSMNQILNNHLQIEFIGYQCLNCGKKKKIFRQGNCYDCFYSNAAVGDWIMKPELSTAHLDIADRDLAYEKKVQLQPHIVYLASSSEVKVGVTRCTQIPTRWIDQGAEQALPIVEVPNRYLAGITEVALKSHFADKTNWRKMLTNDIVTVDLQHIKSNMKQLLPAEVQQYFNLDVEAISLQYPVETYPSKIMSLSLEKQPTFSGKLTGIKGQYLIFDNGTVFNIRSSEGFVVRISV